MNDLKNITNTENANQGSIDYKAINEDIRENGKAKMMASMMNKNNKSRVNAYISNRNYGFITHLMKNEELISMKLSKGAILDLALTNLAISLECGESLEAIAINHLERGE